MKKFPTLYKRAKTGKVQLWFMEVEGNKYRTTSGQVDGKHTVTDWSTAEGKNVGRANEVTPAAQAVLEVESIYRNKMDKKHYVDDISKIDEKRRFQEPMRAEKYDDYGFRPGFSQAKLDGVRCYYGEDGPISRAGERFMNIDHIDQALKPVIDRGFRLDGELYNHELKEDFNKILSLVKKGAKGKRAPTLTERADAADMIQYHVYDLPSCSGGYDLRRQVLKDLIAEINHPSIIFVDAQWHEDEASFDAAVQQYVEDGYEGGMWRAGDEEYVFERTKALLKCKPFVDEEYTVLRIEQGDCNWAGKAKGIWFQMPNDGPEFKATLKGNMAYCATIWERRSEIEGRWEATVKRAKGLTPAGKPRFGVVKKLWEGKRDV